MNFKVWEILICLKFVSRRNHDERTFFEFLKKDIKERFEFTKFLTMQNYIELLKTSGDLKKNNYIAN